MKKIFYSILLSGMMVLSACDALDLSPEDYYGSNDFWNQKSQVEMFMTGIHADLRDKYQMPVTLGEFRSEILISDVTSMGEGVYGPPMTNNLLTKDNTGIDDWYEVYPNIMHINLFIRNVDKEIDYLTGTEKSFYLGQAYGLRAYYYFYLYRTFGGVPLETEPKVTEGSIDITQLYKARSTPEETLEFIKEDINKSEAFFNESDKKMSNQYEWSYHATELLKAKIYMWSAKVTTGLPDDDIAGDHIATLTAVDPNNSDLLTAKKALLNLVNQQFELLPNFADLWTPEGKKNKEIIFALCFNKNELTNWGANWFYNVALFTNATDLDGNKYGPDPLKLLTAGPLRYEYKVPFIEIYDKEDTRLDATFFQYMFEGKTRGACWKKLMGHTDGGTHYYDSDVPVYRYADVLLMLAECENGLGAPDKCAAYINEVRKRAYGDKFEQHKYIAGDYADNEWAILQERDKEFVGEGSRFAWCCSDEQVVRAYEASELCGFTFTVDADQVLFQLMDETYRETGWKLFNPDLPVLFIGGYEDPCIGGARKFAQAVQTMRRVGYMDTKGKLYPGMRHEILNEREKEKVYHDVKKYIEKKLNI